MSEMVFITNLEAVKTSLKNKDYTVQEQITVIDYTVAYTMKNQRNTLNKE